MCSRRLTRTTKETHQQHLLTPSCLFQRPYPCQYVSTVPPLCNDLCHQNAKMTSKGSKCTSHHQQWSLWHAGAIFAITSRLHGRTGRYFTTSRPSSALQILSKQAHRCHSQPVCRKSFAAHTVGPLASRSSRAGQSLGQGNTQQQQSGPLSLRERSSFPAASVKGSESTDASLLWSFGRGLASALTAAALALALLFCSSPTAYAAAFPFAPSVSSSPATLEMKVNQHTGLVLFSRYSV